MSDRDIDAEQVRHEHMDDVNTRAHLLYLAAVLGGGALLMLLFLVILDAVT